jgi:hypothetical protein
MDERSARLHAHQRNIDRYQGLLKTKLSEAEKRYLEKRLSEERVAIATLGVLKPSAASKGYDVAGALEECRAGEPPCSAGGVDIADPAAGTQADLLRREAEELDAAFGYRLRTDGACEN